MNEKIRIDPPFFFFAYLLMGVIIYYFFPVANFISPPLTYLGIPVILFGVAIELWADSLFKKNKTTVKPHGRPSILVTEGPFGLSRHPMYTGFILILFGLTLILGNIFVVLAPIAMFFTLEILFIPFEEQALEEIFKDKYVEYQNRVRKWL